jgi:hypothetical protein
MDKTLTIGIVLLVIVATATAGFFLLTKNQPNENLIGGQTDEHGCPGAAGYSWNKDVKACIREWELNENQKKAAKIAVEYVNPMKGVTIKSVDVARCPGCFQVNLILGLNSGNKEVSVTLENWQVKIDTFEACANAGNPIMESYPRQCSANGQTFVEKTGSNEAGNEGNEGRHACTAKDIAAEACTMIYDPVCGDDGITYGNGCSACASRKIESYVSGECTTTKECGPCPNFMPPAPGWCENGVIIQGQKDECGCQAHPQCEKKP